MIGAFAVGRALPVGRSANQRSFRMKKNRFYFFGMVALVLLFALVLASCGADPKELAQQTYDLSQEALGVFFNPQKATELQKKAADIEKKVAKLSSRDRRTYDAELARLSGQGLGGLINAASNILNATSDLLNNNSVQGTQGTQNSPDTQDALNTAGQALDMAQRAIDLLNSLGD